MYSEWLDHWVVSDRKKPFNAREYMFLKFRCVCQPSIQFHTKRLITKAKVLELTYLCMCKVKFRFAYMVSICLGMLHCQIYLQYRSLIGSKIVACLPLLLMTVPWSAACLLLMQGALAELNRRVAPVVMNILLFWTDLQRHSATMHTSQAFLQRAGQMYSSQAFRQNLMNREWQWKVLF